MRTNKPFMMLKKEMENVIIYRSIAALNSIK
jgi:hypothetical protein